VRTATGAIAGGAVGDSDVLVAEADESDGSFLNYEPYIAVVTNIEPDHLDHYGSKEAFEQAFVQFAQRITPTGALVACADDPGARALADEVARQGRIAITYGQDGDADISITNLTQIPGTQQATFDVSWSDGIVTGLVGGTVHLELQVPGIHNALNATGAFAALLFLGITPEEAARGLHEFVGTGRRFEERGVVDGVTVVDDYAHHPTEVAALLSAARVSAGAGRVLVLFQPHLYSRTRIFAAEFASALDHADETVLTAIYAAREDHDPATSSQMIAELMRSSVQYVPEREAAAREIARRARTGDLILTVGAGDVTELGDVVLDELQKLRS
jgi:UDP-N-acetylmuramate--alanine ligase